MEGKKVVVARILIDSIIDRQGLLRTGDVILQANGKTIKDPEQLQLAIEESGEFVVFKIQPSDINQKEIDSALPKAGKVAKVGLVTVFENHRKSLIQHCERSELRLHFEWTKVNSKCQKWSILANF